MKDKKKEESSTEDLIHENRISKKREQRNHVFNYVFNDIIQKYFPQQRSMCFWNERATKCLHKD